MKQGSSTADRARAVRAGEELPLDRLLPWLQSNSDKLPVSLHGQPEVTQFYGGASNWTYRLKFGAEDLILRRAPDGTKAKGAHDMGREFRLQQALKSVYPLVPEMYVYCDDPTVIGSEFYLMERIRGIIPRKNLPPDLHLDREQVQQLCANLLDSLIELHKVDYKAAGLDGLAKGAGYTQRQIDGWSTRYRKAKTWNVPSGEKIMAWLQANMPGTETLSLTHNDFRLDNLVLDVNEPTRIIGVLDWELATIGDPLMDLGNTLAYWIEAGDDFMAQKMRRQPTHLPGMMTREQLVARYAETMNIEIGDFRFYEVYGYFRLAGIIQQIYYRYHHGQTRNPAFKRMWLYVHYLLWRCTRIIKKGAATR